MIGDLFDAVDLFAGPGGWSEGMRSLGLRDFGLELDDAACRTRYAAGHATWQVDVTTVDPRNFIGVRGLVASPPCQDDSQAGRRAGRDGEKGRLTDLVPEWVAYILPEWIACEQVPEALPTWRAHAERYRDLGYSTWAGLLCAANFGVPQKRVRSFLLASRVRPVTPPHPTHSQQHRAGLFGDPDPWVTMAEALGYGPDPGPDFARRWPWEKPATTVCGDPRISRPGHRDRAGGEAQFADSIRTTLRDRLVLQSFDRDYPVQGNQKQQDVQVGNAVPPRLAAAVVAALQEAPKHG